MVSSTLAAKIWVHNGKVMGPVTVTAAASCRTQPHGSGNQGDLHPNGHLRAYCSHERQPDVTGVLRWRIWIAVNDRLQA